MKDKNKINLENIKTKNMSNYARKSYIKKREIKPEIKPPKKEINPFIHRVITKSVISIAVCISVLAISTIDNEIFNEAEKGINYLINHETDFEETFSVFSGLREAIPVVSDTHVEFSAPTNGTILSDLRDEDAAVVGKLYSAPDGYCYAAGDGVVFYVDKASIDCPYIRLRHEGGYDTVYMGIVSQVDVGDSVKRQQILGECIGDNLGFILMQNSQYIDSDNYIETFE